jgi:hypothetical protein
MPRCLSGYAPSNLVVRVAEDGNILGQAAPGATVGDSTPESRRLAPAHGDLRLWIAARIAG